MVPVAAVSMRAEASLAYYTGTIGKQRVSVFVDLEQPRISGIYFYDRHRTPIRLKPAITHSSDVSLDELDSDGIPVARVHFGIDGQSSVGTWTDYRTGKQLPITLTRVAGDEHESYSAPVLQAASTAHFYFVIPSLATGRVTAIEVRDKRTGALAQTLTPPQPLCPQGFDTVSIASGGNPTVIAVKSSSSYCPGATFQLATPDDLLPVNGVTEAK